MASTLLALVIAPAQSAMPPLGDQIEWVEHYVSSYMPAFDYPHAIAVDASGNVLVTGGSEGPDQLPDITTIQYSRTGQTQWVRRLDGRGDSWDQGQAIAVDQVRWRHLVFLPKDTPAELRAIGQQILAGNSTINEDVAICSRVQAAHASGFAPPGNLLPRSEHLLTHFYKLIVELVAGSQNNPTEP